MPSLLTTSQKNQAESLLNDLHDTYKKSITYFLEREILTLSADGNYNSTYGESQDGVNKTSQIVSGVINARIFYPDFSSARSFKSYPDPNVPYMPGRTQARLKVDISGYDIISKAQQIKLPDNQTYMIVTAPKPIAPFNLNYMSILLEQVK